MRHSKQWLPFDQSVKTNSQNSNCRHICRRWLSWSSSAAFSHVHPNVTVQEHGTTAKIVFPSGETSIFHAPWLWSNDPTFIHPTSGQRLRTAASYTGQVIQSAQMVVAEQATADNDKQSEMAAVRPIPPPPPGCLHPMATVYQPSHQGTSNSSSNQQWLLQVCWEPKKTSTTMTGFQEQPLESYYDVSWLQQCRYDPIALQQLRADTKIDARCRLHRIHDDETENHRHHQLWQVDFHKLFHCSEFDDDNSKPDPNVLFDLLHSIVEYGAALVTNAPPASSGESVARVGKALAGGSLSHGALYGDVFHVQSMADAHNLAYTSAPLQPHQDLAYYESMPGLQLLHCLANDEQRVVGGESTLIDAMAAAEEFRTLAPYYFETLVKCSATFIKQREGADMVYRRPHIVLDDDDDHGDVVVTVNWSPPFEGPLSIAPEHVEDYFRAYSAFSYMLDNSLNEHNVYPGLEPTLVSKLRSYAEEHTWERRLLPGEILIFNNRRLLHGRRGFEWLPKPDHQHGNEEGNTVGRHLIGCYTNIDDTLNQYRLLLRNQPDRSQRVVRNFGNGSIGTR